MTTPNQTSPDGAIVVGGGQWLYGQTVNEDIARAAFELPMPTPDNMLELLRIVLESLPLEALQPFADFLGVADGLFTLAGDAVEAILGSLGERFLPKFEEFLSEITNLDSWLIVFKNVIDFFKDLLTNVSANAFTIIKELVDFLSDFFTVPGSIITWLTGLGGGVVSSILTEFETFLSAITNRTAWLAVLKSVIDFFATVTNFSTWVGVFKTVVDTFVTLLGTIGLNVWTVLSEILTFFSGQFTVAGSVLQWIKDNIVKLPAGNLVGQIADNVLGLVNIGHLTAQPVNLLSSPGFATLDTISAVDGWSWDSSQNATGTGGSAKVVCDGYNKELSHQTAVRVAAGDIMQLSAAVKTSSVTGTGWKASISVMEYRDGAIATPVEIASRTSNTSSWVTISGGYTVPANVSSVVFRLTVTDALSGTVWFDDLDIHKSGAIVQDWVDNLNTTWENIYTGTFGTSGTGKKWFDVGPAIATMTSNTSLAKQAGDNAQGNVQTTWNALVDGFDKTTGSVGKTPTDVRTRGQAVRDQADLGVLNAASASGAASAAAGVASAASGAASAAAGAASVADGKAVSVATGLRTTVGGEPGTTGVPASTGTYLSNLITKMYGTGASVPQTFINNAALNQIPTTKLFGDISGATITSSTIPVGALAPTTIPAIGTALGTAITTGSGAKMSRTNTATKVTAGTGDNWFSAFFVNAGGSIQQDQISSDITVSLNGRYTVTHAGYYIVELGFTVNAARPAAGYFNVAPAIFLNGSSTPYKVGSDAMGSFGGGFGNNARTAHATFIVYLAAGGTVTAGYRNYGASNGSFFEGDANGNSTYFSIAMLNRTAQG